MIAKRFKKFLSAMLAVAMLMQMFPTNALAAGTITGDGYRFENGVLTITTNAGTTAWQDNPSLADKSQITSVEGGSGVTIIGDDAFNGCTKLTTVNIPEATIIGNYAFYNCEKLTTVNILEATRIGDDAFNMCHALDTINFPKATTIGNTAFADCALVTVDFPKAINLGNYTFYYCEKLITANFPKVTTIGNSAFENCSILTTLGLGATPPSIGTDAFLVEGTPPARSLKFIDETGNPLTGDALTTAPNAYKAVTDGNTEDNLWYGWEFVPAPVADKITVTYSENGTDYTEKGGASLEDALTGVDVNTVKHLTVKAGEVTTEDWNWIKSLTALTHFTVADTDAITTIADMPDGYSSILSNSIVEANISKLAHVGNYAFVGCRSLEKVDVPNVTTIGTGAFKSCEKLATVNFPKMTTIGDSAFNMCNALETADFPSVTTISAYAFYSCPNLRTVNFPKVTTFGNNIFYNCKVLTTLGLGATPPSVGVDVFYGIPSIRSLNLLDENGDPLTGENLTTARNAYKVVTDGNTGDNKWYGWEFVPAPVADKIKVAYSENGIDYTEKGGASLEDALTGVDVNTVKHLTVKAGEMTEVDWNWIHNLTALTHFTVEDTVTTIANMPDGTMGKATFPTSIVEVNMPKVISVGKAAFFACEKLTTANFPEATSIGDFAFADCSALETVNSPNVTTIGARSFYNCTKLTTANFPNVTTIGDNAFGVCTDLTTANLPKVTSIGDYAFKYCGILTTLGLDATPPTSVGIDAFSGTANNRSLNLLDETGAPLTGDALTTAQNAYKAVDDGNTGDNLWHGWVFMPEPVADKIKVAYSENGIDYTEKGGASLEDALDGVTLDTVKHLTVKAGEVTTEDWNWIHNLTALTHFTVEDTVTSVAYIPGTMGKATFPTSIVEVNMPKVISIGKAAFFACEKLTTANFPEATSIGDFAFADCSALETVNSPKVTIIGLIAFRNCSALETVNFPKVTSIGEGTFSNCASLETVNFPNVTTIGESTFAGCESLETVNFPNVKTIGESTFAGCESLETVSIPKVTTIGNSAFYVCEKLTTANFPKVTSIADGAFYNCSKLTILGLGETPPSVGGDYAFKNTPDTRSLKLLDETGSPLTGDAITIAQNAYKAVADGDTADNLWYGFKIFNVIKTYNVTVKNGTANKTTAAEGDTVTITADAPPSGKMFDCWKTSDGVIFANSNASQTTFEMPPKEVTVTATYKNLSSGTISGKVTEEDGTAVAGATVEIIKSNKDKATAVTTTNANGEYTISDIRYGVYSLVVTHGERTNTSIVVIGEETVKKNITLLSGKKDTVLEVNPEVTTPAIAVENLEKMFDGTEDDAKDTKIKLVISDKTTSKPDEKKVKSKVNGQKKIGIYLDASLVKIVEGEEPKNIQPPTGKSLKIIVDVPVEAQNKAPYFVVRVHDENVETFEATYDEIHHTVTFNADKFSTYAIAYTDPTVTTYDLTINGGGTGVSGSGKYAVDDVINISAGTKNDYTFSGWTTNNGGKFADANSANTTFTMTANAVTITANWTKISSGSTSSSSSSSSDDYYNITVIKGENGSISPDGGSDNKVSVREYQDQKFTITADEGYVISDVLVDDKSVGARDKYTFEDVRKNHTIKVVFEEKSEANKDAENPFADVRPDDWFYDEALTIMKKGIMTGTADTKFSPYIGTTRATIATIIYRLENEPKANAQKPFKDVLTNQWYTDAINWCAEYGIVKGCGNDLFKPNQIITRQELCTILYRYLGYKGYDVSKRADLNAFVDEKETSNWAKDSVSYAVKTSLLKGNDRSELQPKNQATRAEVATVILNALKLLEA